MDMLVINIFYNRIVSFLLLRDEIIDDDIIAFVQEFFYITEFSSFVQGGFEMTRCEKSEYFSIIIRSELTRTSDLFFNFFLTGE